MKQDNTLPGLLGAIWGFCGAFMLISYAVWRLAPLAMDTFNYSLSVLQWSALTVNILFMAYSEGYKGFQQAFAPRVAARSLYLSKNPSFLRVLLAPLFVIGYFDATRHRMIISYLLTSMIIVLVVLTRMVDQPWRGHTAPVRHLEGVQDQLDSHMLGDGPTDNLAGKQVQDHCKI